MAVDI